MERGCKLHGIDPYAYFSDMLKKISTHHPVKIKTKR
ncbi:MAG: transposase domain-containing protein [Sedimentisphaeraceae bacterium JB056]